MRQTSNGLWAIALTAGIGLGIGCGYLMGNDKLRARLSRQGRKIAKTCRKQSEELRETASQLMEAGERSWQEARDTGSKLYHRVAG